MILCLTLLALQTPAAPAARVDWAAFLARHDLVWDRLPTRWGESAFIGNGRLGATIDAQGGVLGWTINRTDFVHDQSRYPIGRVVLKTAGTVQGGTVRLTLWDAEASGTVPWILTGRRPRLGRRVKWLGRRRSHPRTCIRRRPSRARERRSRACRRSSGAGPTPSRLCPHPLSPSPFRRGGTRGMALVPPLPRGEGVRG